MCMGLNGSFLRVCIGDNNTGRTEDKFIMNRSNWNSIGEESLEDEFSFQLVDRLFIELETKTSIISIIIEDKDKDEQYKTAEI